MYKLVVHTTQNIQPPQSSLHRYYLISQNKSTSQQLSSPEQSVLSITQKLEGQLYLYHDSLPESRQKISIIKDKSRVMMFYNPPSQVIESLQQNLQEIQNYDIITLKKAIQLPESQSSSTYYVVVFKSFAIAEDFNKYLGLVSDQFYYIYLQDCAIFSGTSNSESYEQQKMFRQNVKAGEKWIRIPTCPKCLQLLEIEVTGICIPENSNQNQYNADCSVCERRNKKVNIVCQQCSKAQDIWICLICGALGCGRYKNADAERHYNQSNHPLSYDLQTGGIWNYSRDCFSHKIIGKQAELMMEGEPDMIIEEEDEQKTFWKYCAIVSEQLDEQRKYYKNIQNDENIKFQLSLKQINDKIQELSTIRANKGTQLKKRQKKVAKQEKRNKQLQEQCEEERIILSELERSAKIQYQGPKNLIQKKKKQIEEIEAEISAILMKLT